ncbi:hypothetical protein SeMB42_g07458 [Synchytrium endobioticum]|uniref:General transcription and DNA repair factor IIH subunit TFB4 n=1 Tax=Synchytrium endobioticum TaxID=286115 RepID=A0A507D3X5_9FUNG|nr:hypothetical protein SeMB42_g07458 [Synchytrium endobioticum]TPX39602.1 hypothetical protein SeLEV6574_g07103 [Synchytrium endobioticum]TPX46144.1 hypothetical protein SeLEV6574_g03372 [Synchytrium endobioticum]
MLHDGKINLLVSIIDVSPAVWATASSPAAFCTALDAILMYYNAHLAFSHGSQVAVITSGLARCQYVYPSPVPISNETIRPGSAYENFWQVKEAIHQNIRKGAPAPTMQHGPRHNPDTLPDDTAARPGMASALAMALSYINKRKNHSHGVPFHSRILVLSVSPDNAGEYVGLMNASFSAQKSAIPIDVCRLMCGPSVFLGQAAYLTKGVYLELSDMKTLLQTLITVFMADTQSRDYLVLPASENVDLRAACFCHRQIVNRAFVCSVCLAAFCDYHPVCPTCKTTFSISTVIDPKATSTRATIPIPKSTN